MKANIKWLDDPEVFRVNQLPAHSDHPFYKNYREWQNSNSSFVQSLDGNWKFKFSKDPQSRPIDFYKDNFDSSDFGSIKVPSEIELSDYTKIQYINSFYPWEGKIFRRPAYALDPNDQELGSFSEGIDNTVGSYIRYFDLNPELIGKDVHIKFDGVERAMYVWLNGHFVGYAEDSFTPSEFDLTPFVKDKSNVLAVQVFKHSTASWLEDQDMFRFSGIFRSVELLGIPTPHLSDLDLKPTVTDDFKDGIFNAKLHFAKATGSLHLMIKNIDGRTLLDKNMPIEETISIADEKINNIHLWDNHNPYLYQVLIEIYDKDDELVELVPYQFGFRKIEISEDKVLLLNGKRLIINGVNRHEWNAKSGRTITLDDMTQDIATFKENNINAVRTCHYPNQIPWYYLCDKNGIYMMAENNLETHGTWQKLGQIEPSFNVPGDLPQWRAAVIDRARSNYETFKNHTAILFWSLGNESYAGADIVAMNEFYKKHDSSRLTHYEGVVHRPDLKDCISDVESVMYWPPEKAEEYLQDPKKPFLECEYMHDMGNSAGGLGSYIDLIDKYPQYAGGFIWDFIDQAISVYDPITKQEVLRYGGDFDDRHADYEFSGDGLMFADRTPKPAMQEVKYYYGLHK